MRVDILSIFPAMFSSVFSESIPKIAQEKQAIEIYYHDIRSWADNKHGKVDDRPFGGGPGMVFTCQPVVSAVNDVRNYHENRGRLIFFTPEGKRFNQNIAKELALEERIVFVCGRYEGFDERIFSILQPERLSLGDFILSGGEIAAMAAIDSVMRLLPGVLGCQESNVSESFNSMLLDYPHYTHPANFLGLEVPAVLRSGNHAEIANWRKEAARKKTQEFRPDLLH